MNIQLVIEVIKQLLTVAGTVLVSTSVLSPDDTNTIVGAVMALIGVGSALWNKREVGIVKSAAALGSVKNVTIVPGSKPSALIFNDKVSTK